MDDRAFRKHLRDLVHGKHNPAEHDWSSDSAKVTGKRARIAPDQPGSIVTRARSSKPAHKSKKR